VRPEENIQIGIVEALSILNVRAEPGNRFLFFSIPNEGYLSAVGSKKPTSKDYARLTIMRKMGLVKGAPDLLILHKGRAYCMEVKSEKGGQTKEQWRFEMAATYVGVPYAVVKSVSDAVDMLKEWGIIE
jgi:hypothetical protein